LTSSGGDLHPLPIWLAEGDQLDMEKLRAAKAALELPYRIKPVDALRPGDSRILAVGTRPPWLCDYYFIAPTASAEVWQAALRWVLGEVDDDWDATTVIDILSAMSHGPVRLIPQEELDGEAKFHDYVNGVV